MKSSVFCVALVIAGLAVGSLVAKEVPADQIDPNFSSTLYSLIKASIKLNIDEVDPTGNETLSVTHQERYKWWKWKKYDVITKYTNIQLHDLSRVNTLGTVSLDKTMTNHAEVKFKIRTGLNVVSMNATSSWLDKSGKVIAVGVVYEIWMNIVLKYDPESKNGYFECTFTDADINDLGMDVQPPEPISYQTLADVTSKWMTPLLRIVVQKTARIMMSKVEFKPLKEALDKFLKTG